MRKLIFGINLTLDGCCDHAKGVVDEDLHDFYTQLLLGADTFLYGRKTYQLMVPFWPEIAKNNSGPTKSMNDFAHAFAAVKKIVVFSKTLTRAEESNTIIARGDLRDEVLKLKNQEGRNILTGGVELPAQLAQLGLIDEYYFVVHPLLGGKGRRLFENIQLEEHLQFVDSKVLRSGCVALHYSSYPG